jgi:hypothetical protein
MTTSIPGSITNNTAHIKQELSVLSWTYDYITWNVIDTSSVDWNVIFSNDSTVQFVITFDTNINLDLSTSRTSPFKINSSYITLDGNNKSFIALNSFNYWFGLITTQDILNLESIGIINFNVGNPSTTEIYSYLCHNEFCTQSSGTIIVSNCINNSNILPNEIGGLFGYNAFYQSSATITISILTNNGEIANALCGGLFGFKSFNNCTGSIVISNCINNGNLTDQSSGGLFGPNAFNNCTCSIDISDCINYGNLTHQKCGGLFGFESFNTCSGIVSISQCKNTGAISGSFCGGIFGSNSFTDAGSKNTIFMCENTGNMSADGCGGICSYIGSNMSGTTKIIIDNCVNSGDIDASNCGGLVFQIYRSISEVTFQNSYSIGGIGSGINVKSIITTPSNGTKIDNCYILHGDFTTPDIIPTKSYNANGLWTTSDAISQLRIDGTWVYYQDSNVTVIDHPFVLHSLNQNNPYVFRVNDLTFTTIGNQTINATVIPAYTSTNTNVPAYTTTTTTILDISANGIQTIGKGEAQVKATQADDLINFIEGTEIDLSFNVLDTNDLSFSAIPNQTINATVIPAYTSTNTNVPAYTTTTTTILDISANGIQTIGKGEAQVKATQADDLVNFIEGTEIDLSFNVLDTNDLSFSAIPNQTINATVIPSYTSDNKNTPTYTVTSTNISIDATGYIHTDSKGEAQVKAIQADDLTNFIEGTEIDLSFNVFDSNDLTFSPIGNQTINATVDPSYTSANKTTPIYSTTTTTILDISANVINTIGKGEAQVKATQADDLVNFIEGTEIDLSFNVLEDNTLEYDTTGIPYEDFPFSITPKNGTKNNTGTVTFSNTNAIFDPISSTNGITSVTFNMIGNQSVNVVQVQDIVGYVDGCNKIFTWSVVQVNTIKFVSPPMFVDVGTTTLLIVTTPSTGLITFDSSNTSGSVDFIQLSPPNTNSINMLALTAGVTTISVNQEEMSPYGVGEASFELTIKLKKTTLIFDPPIQSTAVVGESFEIYATSNREPDDIIHYSSSDITVATVNGTIVTVVGVGNTTITAFQTENGTYEYGSTSLPLTTDYGGYLLYDTSSGYAVVIGAKYSLYNLVILSEGDGFTVIGIKDSAFLNGLTTSGTLSGTITFPTTLTFIGKSAFQGCALTGPLILPDSIETIGAYAFQGCALTGPLILPDSIETIGAYAFRDCGLGGMLILPPNLTVLEDYVFAECDFTSMAPPTQLTHIGARAFYNLPLFVYDFTQCEQLSYIDPSAFDEYNQSFLDINVYVTRFTYDRLQIPQFPDYVKFHTGVPVSNICFIAGTRVQTDQGILAIETLNRKHTLNGQPITLTKTKHDDPYLVKIQAYAFTNAPTQDTYMSMNHRVYFNHDRVKARDLVNGDTVTLVDYHGEPLYNVLVKAHTSMLVHGMRVETLDPTSPIALVYTSRLPPLQRIQIIQKLNTQENYEETVMYLKRIQ